MQFWLNVLQQEVKHSENENGSRGRTKRPTPDGLGWANSQGTQANIASTANWLKQSQQVLTYPMWDQEW